MQGIADSEVNLKPLVRAALSYWAPGVYGSWGICADEISFCLSVSFVGIFFIVYKA